MITPTHPPGQRGIHRPGWRWFWLMAIALAGGAAYTLVTAQGSYPAVRGPQRLIWLLNLVLTPMLTWAIARVYAWRWGGLPMSARDRNLILAAPLFVLAAIAGSILAWMGIEVALGLQAPAPEPLQLLLNIMLPWMGAFLLANARLFRRRPPPSANLPWT